MTAIVLSAVVVCLGALVLGQAVLRWCGFERWSWLAPPVGLAVALVVAVPSIQLPGHSATTAVLLALLVVASAVVVLRDPATRPPLGGFLAAAPAAAMTLVPFASAGRAGTLGVGVNNDMGNHLWIAELYLAGSKDALEVGPAGYPTGPHALSAAVAEGLGVGVDAAFAGLTAATVVLLAWAVLGLVGGRVPWPGKLAAATVAAMPFLVAGFYGQGGFKELLQTLLVVGVVVALVDRATRASPLRWVPIALLAAGSLSVYGVPGVPWIAGVAGAGAAFALVRTAVRASPRAALSELGAGVVPATVAGAALAIVLVPQLTRLRDFAKYTLSDGGEITGIAPLGNLAARLPLWQAFGIWDNPDYRFPAVEQPSSELWTMLVIALVAAGVVWCARRGEWQLPLAALVTLAIWVLSDSTQTPYVTAKALVIASPLLMLLAIRPLVERDERLPRVWRWAPLLVALVLVVKVAESSVQALRFSPVGPTAQRDELRELRPLLDGKPTLFLGNDDFIYWKLAGVPALGAVVGAPEIAFKHPKGWAQGQALDIDSVPAATINERDWVITTRDAAASTMPPQLTLVRQTRSFALWRRTGTVPERAVLPEGDAGGAVLDCASAAGREVVRGGGTALVRPPSTGVPVPAFPAGTSIGVEITLGPGTYDLSMPYVSPQPIDLEVVGHLKTVMPANLDRPGPRWPVGRITLGPGGKRIVRIGMYARKTRLTPGSAVAQPTSVLATPVGGAREVPVRRACGRYVDFYEPAG